jgi:hypothetical protein
MKLPSDVSFISTIRNYQSPFNHHRFTEGDAVGVAASYAMNGQRLSAYPAAITSRVTIQVFGPGCIDSGSSR